MTLRIDCQQGYDLGRRAEQAHVKMTILYPSVWKSFTTSHTEPLKNFQSSAPNANDAPLFVSVRVPSCRSGTESDSHWWSGRSCARHWMQT